MSPYFNPAGIALIALFIAVLTSAPASALPYLERVLWPSPDEAGDLLDQADGSVAAILGIHVAIKGMPAVREAKVRADLILIGVSDGGAPERGSGGGVDD